MIDQKLGRWFALIVLLGLLAACTTPPTETPTPRPTATPISLQPWIAFAGERDTGWDIFLVQPDGSQLIQVTQFPSIDWAPAISPDGTRMAFMSARYGNFDLFLIDISGSLSLAEQTTLDRLTTSPADDFFPAWSPNGRWLVYHSYPEDSEKTDLFLLDVEKALADDPTAITRLTFDTEFANGYASFSPDGSQIVFVSERDGISNLFLINPDGTGLTQITDNDEYNNGFPAWHPDPERREIAFMSDRSGVFEIYFLNLDVLAREGEALATTLFEAPSRLALGGEPGDTGFPAYSPDGRQLVFANASDIGFNIHVYNFEADRITRLTFERYDSMFPDW